MRDDICEAAFRLSCALPCVTHRRDMGPQRGENMRKKHWNDGKRKPTAANPAIKKVITGRGRGGMNKKPFTVRGRTYNGINEAAARLHKSPHTIRAWLDSGEAQYV